MDVESPHFSNTKFKIWVTGRNAISSLVCTTSRTATALVDLTALWDNDDDGDDARVWCPGGTAVLCRPPWLLLVLFMLLLLLLNAAAALLL